LEEIIKYESIEERKNKLKLGESVLSKINREFNKKWNALMISGAI